MKITIYGAKLDAKTNHITWGFNLTDVDSRCPFTTKLIYSKLKTMRSDSWSFPGKTIFNDDNNETYVSSFTEQFAFSREARNNGIPELSWLPCAIAEPQDMKAHQIRLGCGGATTWYNQFGRCCTKISVEIDVENMCPCKRCLINDRQ
jgi:hypothetical protein